MTSEQYEVIAEMLFNASFSAWSLSLNAEQRDVFNDLRDPVIGDFVIETSNPFTPKLYSVGKLIEVSEDGWEYKIERLDGKIHEWSNARFVKIADDKTLKMLRL